MQSLASPRRSSAALRRPARRSRCPRGWPLRLALPGPEPVMRPREVIPWFHNRGSGCGRDAAPAASAARAGAAAGSLAGLSSGVSAGPRLRRERGRIGGCHRNCRVRSTALAWGRLQGPRPAKSPWAAAGPPASSRRWQALAQRPGEAASHPPGVAMAPIVWPGWTRGSLIAAERVALRSRPPRQEPRCSPIR